MLKLFACNKNLSSVSFILGRETTPPHPPPHPPPPPPKIRY